ncbi:MAG: glycosyl transferase family 1 [Parcubacteria group bacterium]|jgi:glycosyltransferase involved in cell wall biosynthesis|nr:glycosyl transferase family 1 [Parcubacteria group bacterium]|tara:strand:+ start:12591 stop:13733 length:1143 start_codon:yes stop_codon:yes gene_type:complete
MSNKSQGKIIRIGIDARFFGPRQKGLGRYVQKLVENLEKTDLTNSYVIFLRKKNWSEYQPTNPNFKKVLADYPWYSLKEQILMPLKIRQTQVDLMHFPHFNVPIFYKKPFVITIHDLILKKFPTRRASTLDPMRYWFKNLAYQIVINSAVKRAKKIIAVSEFTKKDILKYFKTDSKKIKVIYEGTSGIGLSRPNPNKTKPYLLYVGNAYPHKNLKRLILAFKKVAGNKQGDLRLVLVGEIDYFYKRLKSFVQNSQSSISDSVVFADFISNQELADLYQNASLYVFPSLCEGFGLPPLEAMACQLPVVCSKTSCLPEVLGSGAVYFNPQSVDDMADKILQILKDKELQDKLILKGGQIVKKYQWTKTAQQTLNIYIQVSIN